VALIAADGEQASIPYQCRDKKDSGVLSTFTYLYKNFD
jgi:hypothetical protein